MSHISVYDPSVSIEQLDAHGIHTSDRIMFKRCRRKWDFASMLRKGLEPIRPDNKLWFGRGGHHALDRYYGHGEDPRSAFSLWIDDEIKRMQLNGMQFWDEELSAFDEMRELGIGVLDHYLLWCTAYDSGLTFIKTEMPFKVPILSPTGEPAMLQGTPVFYEGIFDGLLCDSIGRFWLIEHKFLKSFNDSDKLILDEQVGSYVWAAEQVLKDVLNGAHIEGIMYNQIRKKMPVSPELLKRGGLSKNKQTDTTYEAYINALDMHNLKREDYQDFLHHLHQKGNTFFSRIFVRRNKYEINDIAQRIYYEFLDMFRSDLYVYPNPNSLLCSWDCDFKIVCSAMNDGSDYRFLLDSLYQKRTIQSRDSVSLSDLT